MGLPDASPVRRPSELELRPRAFLGGRKMGTIFGEICTSGLRGVPGASAFLAKFGLGRAGAVRGAPTEFRADQRSFGG